MSKIYTDSLGSRGGQSIAVDNSMNVTGIVTATSFSADNINVTGIVTATSFSGDGSNLDGIVAFDAAKVYTYNQLFG